MTALITEPTVIHNFLEQRDHQEIASLLLSSDFPWYLNSHVANEHEEHLDDYQFTHTFIRDGHTASNFDAILAPLYRKFTDTLFLRVKANLQPRTSEVVHQSKHIDYAYTNTFSAVYYINTNNGKTVFDDGHYVSSKANTILIFPTTMIHCGTTCSDQKVRCVININGVPLVK